MLCVGDRSDSVSINLTQRHCHSATCSHVCATDKGQGGLHVKDVPWQWRQNGHGSLSTPRFELCPHQHWKQMTSWVTSASCWNIERRREEPGYFGINTNSCRTSQTGHQTCTKWRHILLSGLISDSCLWTDIVKPLWLAAWLTSG